MVFGENTDLTPHRYIVAPHILSNKMELRVNYDSSFASSDINAFIMYKQGQRTTNIGNNTFRFQNLAGNIHYGYLNKYFVDFTLSYSGTNRIVDKSDRWGLFPAVSVAWLISRENFMKNSSFIDMLKLRAGYGITGNGFIPIHKTTLNKISVVKNWDYSFGDNNRIFRWGFSQNLLAAKHKKYESSYETDIGLDMRLLNHFTFSGDVFYTVRKHILINPGPVISNVIGIGFFNRPLGEVHNKGFELQAGWNGHTGNFRYGIGGNISYAKNTIVNMDEKFRRYSYQLRTGHQIGQQFGLVAIGLFQSQQEINNSPVQKFGPVVPGDIKYKNQNDDHVINNFDRVSIGGSAFPQIYYGATVNLGYKGFDLNVVIQGVAKRTVFLEVPSIFWPLRNNGNLSTWYKNYYRPGNHSTAVLPRLSTGQNRNNFQNNTLWQRNGSFLKVRFVQLLYALPDGITSRLGVNKFSIYLRGRNLLTISKSIM